MPPLEQKLPTIVQICAKYVDLACETGGVANAVREISLGLEKRGLRTVVVCGDHQRGAPNGKNGHFNISKLLEIFVLHQRGHPLLGPTNGLKRILGLIEKPWIGHVHTCFSAFTESAMCYMRQNDVPFVFSPRGKLSPEFLLQHQIAKKMWWMLFARRAVRGATAIGLQSRGESRSFQRLGLPENFCVVPNGYSMITETEHYRRKSRLIDEPYIFFLGPLDPRKQPDLLVRAYAKSRARLSHKLVIVGPNSYGHRSRILQEIGEHNLHDRVVLYGPAYGSEKWQLLFQASCMCLPSRAEGFPLVLCEAIGAGLPMIISKECNFEEAACKGAAIQLETFDESAWTSAIDKICLSKEKRSRMSVAATRLAPRYTWDNIVNKWIKMYESLTRSCVQD